MDQEFLNNANYGNISFLEALLEAYERNPDSVPQEWKTAFSALGEAQTSSKPLQESTRMGISAQQSSSTENGVDPRLVLLIDAYRKYGFFRAATNPLYSNKGPRGQLEYTNFGFRESDLGKNFFWHASKELMPLKQIISTLERVYCTRVGYEFVGIIPVDQEEWLIAEIESEGSIDAKFSRERKKAIYNNLNRAELLETFLHTKYVGQKRFSIEGGETLIPMLSELVSRSANLGVSEFVLGMAHRGRLNVLAHILNKSYEQIFFEFHENYIPESFEYSWDVKYHKGFVADILYGSKSLKITLVPNPSHLEAVDPVVQGQTFAKQFNGCLDSKKNSVLPILVHGDAAFTGQGVVYETLQLSKLNGYGCGGTIHIIVNNQIGFTTLPSEYSSMQSCTDIAKGFGFPVFHVNAEDPESAIYVIDLACEMRNRFGCDVIIDLICYRKYGHNESDEPAFTQPLKYKQIAKKRSIRHLYLQQLIAEGVLDGVEAQQLEGELRNTLQSSFKELNPNKRGAPSLIDSKSSSFAHLQTGVPLPRLQAITTATSSVPPNFSIHPKLLRLLKDREGMVNGEKNLDGSSLKTLDWGMCELLAFGSLLCEGKNIRLSGQDSCRGTFSHRHAVWIDQKENSSYVSLNHLQPEQGYFDVINSPLSEFAVMGFELGYSIANPSSLVLWEAQFGDFCNGAQVTIDQFLSTGEQKWGQVSGLVLLLPHGYEGQGPEHSSGRMERFLTLCGQNNLQVVNPSTPAQFFHLLRRQAHMAEKKPLIVFTPKSLLRHPECKSAVNELILGSFQEILDDTEAPNSATTIVACSGHIYYDLIAERQRLQQKDIAIIRIEQLYPLHVDRIEEIISKYTHADKFLWVQEEPMNMGAASFVAASFAQIVGEEMIFQQIGRPISASPAVGSYLIHKKQTEKIFEAVFGKKAPSIFEIAGKGKDHGFGD